MQSEAVLEKKGKKIINLSLIALIIAACSISGNSIAASIVMIFLLVFIVILVKPWLSLILSFLFLPFERIGSIATPLFGLRPYQVFLFCGFLSLVFYHFVYRKKIDLSGNKLLFPLALFIFINLLSSLFSLKIVDFRVIFFYIFFFLVTVLLYALIDTKKKIFTLINTLIYSALLASFFGIFQYVGDTFFGIQTGLVKTGMGFLGGGRNAMRANSLFYEADIFGGFLAMCSPFVFSHIITARTLKRKALFLVVLSIILLALAMTYSRTAWVSFCLSFLILFFLLRTGFKKKMVFLLIFIMLLGIFLFFVDRLASGYFSPELIWKRIADISEYALNSQAAGRMIFLKGGLRALWDFPFLGIGPAESTDWSKYIAEIERISAFKDFRFVAHNIYLDVLVGCGILGFTAFLYYIITILFCSLESIKCSLGNINRDKDSFWVSAAFLASILSVLIFGLGHSGLTYPNLWIIAALIMCWHRQTRAVIL